jgi:alanine-glyoxylate transaminase / serine-glyoxylate transaminase / serine-pyruvate transaminase
MVTLMPPKLMIPGPVELEAEVLAALAEPPRAHYGDSWLELYHETLALLQQVYQTQNTVLMIPGCGSAAIDAAIHSAFAPGETVIAGKNGWFGERMIQGLEANGVNVITVESDPRQPLEAQTFARALDENPQAAGVVVVHLETSTSVLNPVKEIAQIVRAHGDDCLLLVDAVTGLGGAELQTDAWGIDLCMAASQKALSAPPGLGLISISPRAERRIRANTGATRSWYLDLNRWLWYIENWGDWHPYPVTLPVNIIVALRTALHSLMREGIDNRMARYRQQARQLRDGLHELGMPMFVDEAHSASILTAAFCPEGVRSTEIRDYLLAEHNIQITTGFGAYKERVFRIGHMGGAINETDIDAVLDGLRQFMSEKVISR